MNSAGNGGAGPDEGALKGLRAADAMSERVVLSIKPSPWYVLIRSLGTVVIVVVVASAARWALRFAGVHEYAWALWIGAMVVFAEIFWQILEWASRSYVVTDRRVVRRAGVFRRDIADLPVRNVQHVTVHRSFLERVLGVGTVGIATAGTAWTEVFFVHVDDAEGVMGKVRGVMDRDGKGVPVVKGRTSPGLADSTTPSGGPEGDGPAIRGEDAAHRRREGEEKVHEGVLVIGLVGGIGGGKSEVASVLRELGAVVIDSDREAKAVLERAEVREQLVSWWGPGVVGADGRVDRAAVAKIVFERPVERERLEGLVHPLVKAERAEVIARARAAGATVAVIDAPLLLEAVVDAECDLVVFVDAPREQRLKRVREARGWDEAELDRREQAQWPLERKRAESDEVVVNDGDRERLRGRVREVLERARMSGG